MGRRMDLLRYGEKMYADDYIETMRVEKRKCGIHSTIIVENIETLQRLYHEKLSIGMNNSQLIDWLVHKEINRVENQKEGAK